MQTRGPSGETWPCVSSKTQQAVNFRERLVEAGTHGQRSASDLILGIRQRLRRASVPQHVSRSDAGDRLLLQEKTTFASTASRRVPKKTNGRALHGEARTLS